MKHFLSRLLPPFPLSYSYAYIHKLCRYLRKRRQTAFKSTLVLELMTVDDYMTIDVMDIPSCPSTLDFSRLRSPTDIDAFPSIRNSFINLCFSLMLLSLTFPPNNNSQFLNELQSGISKVWKSRKSYVTHTTLIYIFDIAIRSSSFPNVFLPNQIFRSWHKLLIPKHPTSKFRSQN